MDLEAERDGQTDPRILESSIETHLSSRHDSWRPKDRDPSEDSGRETQRHAILEGLHWTLHDSEECDHSADAL